MAHIVLAKAEFDFDPSKEKIDLFLSAKFKEANYDLQYGNFPLGESGASGRLSGEIIDIGYCRTFSGVLRKIDQLIEHDPELRPMCLGEFLQFFIAHPKLCQGKLIGIALPFDVEEGSDDNYLFAYLNGYEKTLQIYGGYLDERWSFAFIRETEELESAD